MSKVRPLFSLSSLSLSLLSLSLLSFFLFCAIVSCSRWLFCWLDLDFRFDFGDLHGCFSSRPGSPLFFFLCSRTILLTNQTQHIHNTTHTQHTKQQQQQQQLPNSNLDSLDYLCLSSIVVKEKKKKKFGCFRVEIIVADFLFLIFPPFIFVYEGTITCSFWCCSLKWWSWWELPWLVPLRCFSLSLSLSLYTHAHYHRFFILLSLSLRFEGFFVFFNAWKQAVSLADISAKLTTKVSLSLSLSLSLFLSFFLYYSPSSFFASCHFMSLFPLRLCDHEHGQQIQSLSSLSSLSRSLFPLLFFFNQRNSDRLTTPENCNTLQLIWYIKRHPFLLFFSLSFSLFPLFFYSPFKN